MKKVAFITLSRKWILIGLACILVLPLLIGVFSVRQTISSPKTEYCIAIDAGHGGVDGGAVGKKTGITENELNLKYAQKFKDLCEDFGIEVVMTRSDLNGLYDESAENKKRSEMEKRREIINSSGADLMISFHMNSFPLPSCKGAHVFYKIGSDQSQRLASSVQESVCQNFAYARKFVTGGDYYVLNTSQMPAILIECGFLTNEEDEKNLLSEDYCQELCYHILAGVLSYFKM